MLPFIIPGIKAGLGALGGWLSARAKNKPEDLRQRIIQQELARRNMFQGIGAPSLLYSLGYRNPRTIRTMTSRIGAPPGMLGGKR